MSIDDLVQQALQVFEPPGILIALAVILTMITVFAHVDGSTRQAERVDRDWLAPESSVVLWVDIALPEPSAVDVLGGTFRFHELSIEDAIAELHHPKVESYEGYLYLILHGIAFQPGREAFATHDIDFFLGQHYLVTVHDGTSRSIARIKEVCARNERFLGEGPGALMHRIIDTMVDHYAPEVDQLDDRLEALEEDVLEGRGEDIVRRIVELKRDVGLLKRITVPQRDAVARLARREYPAIDETLTYRFRDVYDHLVRFTEEANTFHDRVTALLDAHLSFMSNRLNEVMKVLTLIATIFMPLAVLTGLYGMNVALPHLPGGERVQFWWIAGMMAALGVGMGWWFHRRRWW
ncbi:MAG: magnesium/cobalt transporter CorA [Luteitalea sp.]|nr:magnesium/cobalt transporter CorA [Luteitalea sp.]